MFKKYKDFISIFSKKRIERIDPSKFHDDVALKVEWKPMNVGSANFNTKKLVAIDRNTLEYKMSFGAKIFGFVFVIAGIFLLIMLILPSHVVEQKNNFLLLLSGVMFIAAGIYMVYIEPISLQLSGDQQRIIKGKGHKREEILFRDIYALQLISRYITDTDSASYYNYQINLVFGNGERENLATYSDLKVARDDAKKISSFVRAILWDAAE